MNVRVGMRKDCGGWGIELGKYVIYFVIFMKAWAQIGGTIAEII
jgi:hypothetical protein